MSKQSKLIERLKGKPKDFTWEEAVTVMTSCDFSVVNNSGSKRKFYHKGKDHYVSIHKPHPTNVLKNYQVNELIKALTLTGWIK